MKKRKVVIKLLGTPSSNVDGNAIVTVRGGEKRGGKLCLTELSNEPESERSVCASVYVRRPVGVRRVSALGSWFLSPVSIRGSAD